MDIQKAEHLAVLVSKKNRYESIIEGMETGYSDEWEFRNSHTGTTVDLSRDDWAEIRAMTKRKLDEVIREIKAL